MPEDKKPTPRIGGSKINTKQSAPEIKGLGYSYNEGSDEVKPVIPQGEPKKKSSLDLKIKPKGLGFSVGAPKEKPRVSFANPPAIPDVKLTTAEKTKINQTVAQIEARDQEFEARDQELKNLYGQSLDVDNLFVAARGLEGEITFGDQKIKNKEELEAILSDPNQRTSFYFAKRNEINKYFNITSEKDFDQKLGGGLSEAEKLQFSGRDAASIYDPVFKKQSMRVGELGYKSEFDQFAPDPVAERYQIAQRQYQATDQFNKLKSAGAAVDAYGQPFENPEDFYKYIQNPINRDAYHRRYSAKLKEIGFNSVNDLLKPVFFGEGGDMLLLGAAMERSEQSKKMRISKGSTYVQENVLGKSGTVFNENPNAGSISNISEADLGKLIYEYDLGNNINIDIPSSKGKGFISVNRNDLVKMLEQQGLDEAEVDEVMGNYRNAYETRMGEESYQDKRTTLGFNVGPDGKRYSKYDFYVDARAKSDLSEEERKIEALYTQLNDIYSRKKKSAKGNVYDFTPEEQKQITSLRGQIEQAKRDTGFFGFGSIPEQEFFTPDGMRVEGQDKENTQQVFVTTINAEKKTDIAILKEKRNVVYEQLDALELKYDQIAGKKKGGIDFSGMKIVLPPDYDKEKLDAEYEEARAKDTPYGVKMLGMLQFQDNIMVSDQQKANYIYTRKLKDKILEKKAQVKALNKIIYTNADLTKIEASGILGNMTQEISKSVAQTFTGDMYLTPAEEITEAVNFLQQNGMYVSPDIEERLKEVHQSQGDAQSILYSLSAALQLGIYAKGLRGNMSQIFTSEAAVATRAYMGARYGKTGTATFSLFEKAAVTFGTPFFSYELSGEDGTSGVAEELGTLAFDSTVGVLKIGRFIPSNIIGKVMTIVGRTVMGSAASFTEEAFANVWSELKDNGFDIPAAVEQAFGKTGDERLDNIRRTALTSVIFSAANIEHLDILVKTNIEFRSYLKKQYGNNISEADAELLNVLDQTIKETKNSKSNDFPQTGMATATVSAIDGRGNTTQVPIADQPMVMSSGPVESDQKTTDNSFAGSGAGSEGLKVEKRTGNMGEEFYVSGVNGVVDNKVIYRYNPETGQLEAKGLTSTSEDFVPLNEKTQKFVEDQSVKNGIVNRENAENIAIKNVEARKQSQAKNQSTEKKDNDKVAYQAPTETARRKKERVDKVEASANARYNSKFNEDAQARTGLFTGIGEEVQVQDQKVKDTASEISRNMVSKMKINLTSFFMDGKAVITDLARKKAAKVADYIAPLFKDFDNTLFDTVDTDLDTNEPVRERKKDAVTDKVRESVARNAVFNQVFGTMVSEGRMSKEDAIDNFIVNLLQNSRNKVSEIFGNDKSGLDNFQKLRKDFNNFVAVKYTGSNTFNSTDTFVRFTPMSTTTTKNRKADLKKQAAELVAQNQKRREIKETLQNTEEQGAFVTDDQVDAIRLLNGDITPEEFMENTGQTIAANTTPDQVKSDAEAQAKGLVDLDKYNAAVALRTENDKTREKFRKDLNKKGGEAFNLVSSIKKPFQWKQNRRKRQFFADAALRQFEAQATRAGITLEQFMNTRIEILKRTEKQFQDWLKMSPNLVPLYQVPAVMLPDEIYPNVTKASQLKEKQFSSEKIRLMTGVVLNEQGEAVAFDPTFKISKVEKIADDNFFTYLKKVFDFTANISDSVYDDLSTIDRTIGFGELAEYPSTSTFGKRTSFFGIKRQQSIASRGAKYPISNRVASIQTLIPIKEHQELYDSYPDIGLMNIRIVDDSNLPQVSFRPNYLYNGNGKSSTSPGEVIVNIAKYKGVTKNVNSYKKTFEQSIGPQMQKALRQSVQFMENELELPEASKFVTPTAVRTKVLELKKAGVIDENTEKLINDVVDFYADKNVFQFVSYSNVFADVSKVLFSGNGVNSVRSALENFESKYDLTESDVKSLESIYSNYIDSYGSDSLARVKSLHNAFLTTSKFAGLDNEELIMAEAEASSIPQPVSLEDDDRTVYASFPDMVFQDLKTLTSNLENMLSDLRAKGKVASEYFNALSVLSEINKITSKPAGSMTMLEYTNLTGLINSRDFKVSLDFLDKVFNQEQINFDDGSSDVLFDFNDLMQMEQKGFVFPEPSVLADSLSEKTTEFKNYFSALKAPVSYLESVTDAEARQSFYDMFPGIQNYANGIYDPYKNISEFTKAQLQTELVDSGLVSQKKFDEVYSQYESDPDSFTGSAASSFVDNLKELDAKEQRELRDKIKVRELVEKNIGTAFYSNSRYAAAKVIENAGSKGRVKLSEVETLLKKFGAKPAELDWLDLGGFLERNAGNEFVSTADLMEWASNTPSFVVYDPETASQKRTVSEVTLFGFNERTEIRAEKANFGIDVERPIAVTKSDGTVEFISLSDIQDESIDLYEKFIGRKEFAQFKKALEDLKTFDRDDLSERNKQHLKSLVKVYAESIDELKRTTQLEEYTYNTVVFPGSVEGTYKEHLLTFPFSSNKLFKDYDNKIIDLIAKLSDLEKTTVGKKPTEALAQEINQLENELDNLVKTRDSLHTSYYNKHHFQSISSEVAMHLRTQVVVTAEGERVLYVQEIQSDKVQDFRKDVLNQIKKKYQDVVPAIIKDANITRTKLKVEGDNLKAELLSQGYSEKLVNRYFERESALKEAIDNFKKTTPITESDQFAEIGLKHAMKIASDYGIKTIAFSNGQAAGEIVGAVSPDQTTGINTFYNKTLPKIIKKLSSKFNFETATTKIDRGMSADQKNQITLKTEEYPFYIDKQGNSVVNLGQPLTLDMLDPKFIDELALNYAGSGYILGNVFNTIQMTDDSFGKVAEGMALFQQDQVGAHGATVRTDQGKNIIFALTNPNITTAMHELAHVWESSMTAVEKQMFMDSVGHDQWTRETSEAFARGFEKYLYDGKSPSGSLTSMFENFKKWIVKVYGGIIGTPLEMQISEPMRKMYDAMLGEGRVNDLQQRKTTDVFDDIGNFIKEIKANPEFEGITDSEIYTALMRSGFEPEDVQDYFSLKQRANIAKQQERKGMFQQEADVMQGEEDAMRVVRNQKELIDEIENMDPSEYPIILQTLFDAIEDGDVPLAKAIQDLIAAKQQGADPQQVADTYTKILKAGTDIGRMLQLFRQLTKDTYLSSAEGMFRRNEKKGLNIPEGSKSKIRNLAVELDRIKDLYKQSRAAAEADPFGISKSDPSKTNLQYNTALYDQLQEVAKRFIDARQPFEGDSSITDMYRTFIKGGLMTPGSMSVNTLSNVTKFITGLFVDPLKSGISSLINKVGITEKQYTKTSLKDWWSGVQYGMPLGIKRAFKILKDGTMTQSYQNPDNYVQGYSFYKSFAKFVGLKMDQYRVAAGQLDLSNEELAEKHGFKLNMEGEIPKKDQAIAFLQGTMGFVPDIVFRVMGATDAVFRDFAYFSTVSEQFKFTPQHNQYQQAIKNAKTGADRSKLQKEYNAVRKAYIEVNSDFQNNEANQEAMRYVYNNDNFTTDVVSKVQQITRTDANESSIMARMSRLIGTGVVPFTRIPSNYALELMEFFLPEYALFKLGVNGAKAYRRSKITASGDSKAYAESLGQRRDDARNADRVLARALVGTGIQFMAVQMVKAGAVSGAPDDENPDDLGKGITYAYTLERPYSINLSLVKESFKEMFTDYKSTRNELWDRENDLIIDYRALGVFGAALYMQYKENKLASEKKLKYQNRGQFEQMSKDFALNMFGNFESAGSYIIDQTFVRGIMSVAKAISDDDENKLPAFLSDLVLTLSSGMVPNSLAWMDKWRRNYMVDYDFKEAPAFKAFGIKVESNAQTLFWTKLATKMAERWPIGDPAKYVDLPFVEIEADDLPIKIDAFGKPVQQTPEKASFGSFMYNTFDVFKATRAVAGYEVPDWEALVYLAVKKGDAWHSLPTLPSRAVDTPAGPYKLGNEEFNNLLQYSGMITRDMVQTFMIDNKAYASLIDVNSSVNKDARTGLPVTGVDNMNILMGYEILGDVLSGLNQAGRQIAEIATYTFVDAERKKMYDQDPERYIDMVITEALSPMGNFSKQMYGNQEAGGENYIKSQAKAKYFSIDMDMINDPKRFKNFAKGAMKLFKEMNDDPKTAIVTGRNEVSNTMLKDSVLNSTNTDYVPFDEPKPAKPNLKPKVVDKIKEQRDQVDATSTMDLGENADYVPFD